MLSTIINLIVGIINTVLGICSSLLSMAIGIISSIIEAVIPIFRKHKRILLTAVAGLLVIGLLVTGVVVLIDKLGGNEVGGLLGPGKNDDDSYMDRDASHIDIPYGVTEIKEGQFEGFSNLVSVSIPETVTSIGENAFAGSSLESITILDSVESIGDRAFIGCHNLTSVSIENVEIIGRGAFEGCYNLESITIPFIGLTAYDSDHAYFGYIFGADSYYSNSSYVPSSLKTVVVTNALSIESDAFYGCYNIESITLNDGVERIGSAAFSGCTSIKSLTIPHISENLSYIFDKSIPTSLKSLTLTNASYVAANAFSNCSYIEEIHLNDGITSIGESAFEDCSSLKTVNIPTTVGIIGAKAFYGCESLEEITVPYGVSEIGDSTFYRCTSLEVVNIPDSVNSIGYGVLSYCTSLESISLPFVGSEKYSPDYANFGYIFGAGSYSVHSSYIPSSLKEVVILNADSIGDYAFYNCAYIETINLNSGIDSIGHHAFHNCTALESVNIPDSVSEIGQDAFYNCISIQSVNIPSGVNIINDYTFYGCEMLSEVTIPDSVITIGNYAFSGCSDIDEISIPSGVEYIGSGAFQNCSSIVSLTVPDSVTAIGSSAFSGCISLEEITIPFVGNSYGSSYDTHFGCIFGASSYSYNSSYVPSSLSKVTVTGAQNIGSYAFYNCYGLSEIAINNDASSIGEGAFYGCSSLTTLTIPFVGSERENASYTHFGYIFGAGSYSNNSSYVPTSLQNVVITNATSIADNAFYYCRYITSITLNEEITSIGSGAFSNCESLTDIILPNISANGSSLPSYNVSGSWTLQGDGSIKSNAIGDGSSTTYTITFTESCTFTFSYKVSSESNYDKFYVYKNDNSTSISGISGVQTSFTQVSFDVVSGDVLTFTYSKDGSASNGDDAVYLMFDGAAGSTSAFTGCSSLANVYFFGTESEWNDSIFAEDTNLTGTEKVYFEDMV